MNLYIVGKRLMTVFAFLAISIAVSSAETACDRGSVENPDNSRETVARNDLSGKSPDVDPQKWFEGKWNSTIRTTDGTITSVNLNITPLISGKACATLVYGGKRSCTAKGNYEGEDNNKRVFSLTSLNGGTVCDKLNSLAVWWKTEKKVLSYEVTFTDKRPSEKGDLTK